MASQTRVLLLSSHRCYTSSKSESLRLPLLLLVLSLLLLLAAGRVSSVRSKQKPSD